MLLYICKQPIQYILISCYYILDKRKEIKKMTKKEYLEYLESRNEKLIQLELMINSLQYNVNDKKDNEITKNEIEMEVFKLWYFNKYNKEYEL